MTEELLTVAQVAFLLKAPRRTIEYMVKKGKLKTGQSKKKILITRTSFISLMKEKTGRYKKAKEYLLTTPNISNLTIPGAARLLNLSCPGVYYLIQTGRLVKDEHSKKASITIDSLKKHIEKLEAKYQRAMEYIQCDDTFNFWMNSDIDKMYESERKRRYKNE